MSEELTSALNAEKLTPTRVAIARCCDAYEQTRRALERKRGEIAAHHLASESYRKAIPLLTDPASIPVFIACVTHGMLIDAIENAQGMRLLYAARTANTVFRKLFEDFGKAA